MIVYQFKYKILYFFYSFKTDINDKIHEGIQFHKFKLKRMISAMNLAVSVH